MNGTTTTTTTTTTAQTPPPLDGSSATAAAAAAAVGAGGGTSTASNKEHVAVVGNFKRRRRKVKSTAFSRHYGNSLFQDDDRRCLVGLIVILGALICAGLMIIFKLLEQKNGSLFSSTTDHRNNNIPPPSMMEREHRSREQQHQQQPDFEPLQPSDVYIIPNSMSHIGDKSDDYAELRKSFEESHPYDPARSLKATEEVRKYNFEVFENPSYDVYNCPDQPPEGYPYEWKTPVLLDHWKPDDPNPPTKIHQGLCVFDYRRDYVKALNYRRQELPFVVRGDPDVAQAVERWTTPGYMEEMLGDVMHRAEYSENNHFMYWMPEGAGRNKKRHGKPPKRAPPPGWKPPTKMIRMKYKDWVQHANVTDERLLGPDQPHWYFRLIGCGETGPQGECDAGSSEYLFDELTFFQPRPGLLYMVEPHEQKGLHCRFGMKGVIAENHFDSSRNAIAVMGGERRYILSHPKHCQNLALLPVGHPSARHSAVDWSDPDYEDFPMFANAESNEVVLQAGDVLYLPTNWFHYIISLSMNFQCNSRSGKTADYDEPIHDCGF
jgi:hypothetical protein